MSELSQLPHKSFAEQSVVGGLMLAPDRLTDISGIIDHNDFYDRRHKIIYRAIAALVAESHPIDVLTVSDFLESKGRLDDIGGLSYLGMLAKDTPSAANIVTYANIIKDMSVKRRVAAIMTKFRDQALSLESDISTVIADAEAAIFEIAQVNAGSRDGFVSFKAALNQAVELMAENFEKQGRKILGIPSGLSDLDRIISGFEPGNLVVVAGRPGMGKTTLVMDFAIAAARAGKPVAFFSLEMPTIQLAQRVISSSSGVPFQLVREAWGLTDADFARISTGLKQVSDYPVYVDDTPSVTVADIKSRVIKLSSDIRDKYPDGVGMICIDYLQIMSSGQKSGGSNRNYDIGDITMALKRMSKEFGCPVVLLSQLNRDVEKRQDKRPMCSDLRDSGSIEQDADVILFVYRDEVYNEDSRDKGIAEIIVGKQRNGCLGSVRVVFDGECSRFRDLQDDRGYV